MGIAAFCIAAVTLVAELAVSSTTIALVVSGQMGTEQADRGTTIQLVVSTTAMIGAFALGVIASRRQESQMLPGLAIGISVFGLLFTLMGLLSLATLR